MWSCDLGTTAPLIDEAKSRQDLAKVLAQLRTERKWAKEGWTRRKILEGVDDTFIHHRDHADRMMQGGEGFPAAKGITKVTFKADRNVAEMVIDGSREWENKPHTYRTSIRFSNYGLIKSLPEMTWPERARLLLEDNMRVDCTCDAFRYYYRYPATRKGFALVYEHRPASKRNPGRHGTVCKHLEHALRYIGNQYAVIAGAMKRHHVEESMSTVARINTVLGEGAPAPTMASGTHTFSHADLHDLLTANGHNVHQWRNDHQGMRAYADTIIGNHRAAKHAEHRAFIAKLKASPEYVPKPGEKIGESKALFHGHLHEAVREFGILDAINGLFSEASKRGMGKTAEALRMAAGMAGVEGATITATAKPDNRILDAPAN